MKNRAFGKVLSLVLAVSMLLALTSCGKTAAVEYDITGKTDFTVADATFAGDVVLKGEGGSVTFVNCVFNGNIVNKGGEGARVILADGCKFAEDSQCVLESSVKEATLETDLPKFLIFCEAPSVSCKNSGAVLALSQSEIEFNGKKYPIENAEYFNIDSTNEIVPYSGQEANFHNVAKWTENGEDVIFHLAIFAE